MVRIGVHAHDFFADIFRLIGQINTVAEGFAHFCLAVGTRQTAANFIFRQKCFRLNQNLIVSSVKTADNFTCLLKHWQLILTNRYGRCFKSGDVSSLTDWVSKETNRNTCIKATHLYFRFNRRISFQSRNCN